MGDKRDAEHYLPMAMRVDPRDRMCSNSVISKLCPLRQCNTNYRNYGGRCIIDSHVPETEGSTRPDYYSPLSRFINRIGAMDKGGMICFPPTLVQSLPSFSQLVVQQLSLSVDKGMLWCPVGTVLLNANDSGTFSYSGSVPTKEIQSLLSRLQRSQPSPPLSTNTWYAHAEANLYPDVAHYRDLFPPLEETTCSTGLIGTLANNECVDMSPNEKENEFDMEKRSPDRRHLGLLCAAYTSHSKEAGRMRRTAMGTSVRVMGPQLLQDLHDVLDTSDSNSGGDWAIHCMGIFHVCPQSLALLVHTRIRSLMRGECGTVTSAVDHTHKIVQISVSSGVLNRPTLLGTTGDEWALNDIESGTGLIPGVASKDACSTYMSCLYNLVPYVAADSRPRLVMSGVQATAAAAFYWTPATSVQTPLNSTHPIVPTMLYRQMLESSRNKPDPTDLLPGENIITLLANWNENYEDCAIISRGSIERGLFGRMVRTSYVVSDREEVPDTGKYANIFTNKWYKNYRWGSKTHLDEGETSTDPSHGRVISNEPFMSGKRMVRTCTFEHMETGDKIATLHGQKFTVLVVDQENMPWGVDCETGEKVFFDAVISSTSIIKRMTAGQWYEIGAGIRRLKSPAFLFEEYGFDFAPEMTPGPVPPKVEVYMGETGEKLTRINAQGKREKILHEYGCCRFSAQTQVVRDRLHYTHTLPSSLSLNPGHGRSGTGRVRFGEMEMHSTEANGFRLVQDDLKLHSDVVNAHICCRCHRQAAFCRCVDDSGWELAMIPYSALRYDAALLVTSGLVMNYYVS